MGSSDIGWSSLGDRIRVEPLLVGGSGEGIVLLWLTMAVQVDVEL